MSNVVYFNDRSNLDKLLQDIYSHNEISIDVETTSLDVFSANWLTLQLGFSDTIYVLDIRELEKKHQGLVKYIVALIKDSKKMVVGHNIKFDCKIIFINTDEYLTNVYDTMVSEVMINQGVGKQFYSLVDLIFKYLGIEIEKETRNTFINFTGQLTNDQIYYAAGDVQYLKPIKDAQVKILAQQKQLTTLEIETQNTPVAMALELNGVLIDEDHWKTIIEENKVKLNEKNKELFDQVIDRVNTKKYKNAYEVAQQFSIPVKTKKLREILLNTVEKSDIISYFEASFSDLINSPKQMLAMLNFCGIPVTTTNEKDLAKLKGKYPIIDSLFDYREYAKRVGTYGENILAERNPVTGRYHFDYNQVGTATGRYSVSRMQQIPREAKYRRGFIARVGYKILSSDYNQQEYRLAGALTRDDAIIGAYNNDIDMHTLTGSIAYKTTIEHVAYEQRQNAKSINFALLYDSTVWGLAYNLNISVQEAEELWQLLRKSYPTFIEYREFAKEMVWKHKFSTTPLGRKRYFEDKKIFANADLYLWYKKKVMREGWNHMIQGWGADITKMGMNYIFYENPFSPGEIYFYNQAHDEVDMEILSSKQEEIKEFVEMCLLKAEQPQLVVIPAKVESRILDYWSK